MPHQKNTPQTLLFSVGANGRAVVACPKCGTRNELDVSRFKKRAIPLPYTCGCGHSFACRFNFHSAQAEIRDHKKARFNPVTGDLPLADISADAAPVREQGAIRQTAAAPRSASPLRTPNTGANAAVSTFAVDRQGRARIVCPHCGKAKAVAIKSGQLSGKVFPVSCGCGCSFSCRFVSQERLAAAGQRNVYFPLLKEELSGRQPLIFHVDSKGEATIICPNCNNFKIITPSNDDSLNGLCGFHCQCGSIFPFKIDFRRAYRKPVDLEGRFYNLRQKEQGELRVRNLSLGGLGIYVEGEALDGVHGFEIGDLLEVSFCLDDAVHSEINRRVEVRTISGPSVGCRFADNRIHDKELGFYLMA